MTDSTRDSDHRQETPQIVHLLGELKGQMHSLQDLLHSQVNRMDRQDERVNVLDDRIGNLRRDAFNAIDDNKAIDDHKVVARQAGFPAYVTGIAFDRSFCEKVIDLAKNLDVEKAVVTGGDLSKVRKSTVRWIGVSDDSEWLYRDLTDMVVANNEEFWNFELEAIESLQFAEYDSTFEGFYGQHMDLLFDEKKPPRKLSFAIPLNDDFEGGEFRFQLSGEKQTVDMKVGEALLFPSFLIHEVTPVISGVRYSLVGWVQGPSWR